MPNQQRANYVRLHVMRKMKLLLVLLFLSVCIAVCKADWQDGNDGVDRLGGDLPNMPISLKTGSAPKDCAQLCYSSSQCKAWAFCKPNCGGSTGPQCYLKVNVTQQSLNPCRVWKFLLCSVFANNLGVSC